MKGRGDGLNRKRDTQKNVNLQEPKCILIPSTFGKNFRKDS